jgi:hypothetical protein
MEACEFCKRVVDPADEEAMRAHRRDCLFAALAVTVGGESPHPPGVRYGAVNARRKRRGRVKRGE